MTRILLRAPKSPFDVRSAEATIEHNLVASNSGNLLFTGSAWKLLSAPGVELVPDRLEVRPRHASAINERFDAYVVPLANAFRPSFEDQLVRLTELICQLRIPVVVLGVGAQGTVDYDWSRLAPMRTAVQEFVAAVLDRSPSIGVRGEGTLDYLQGLGFHDVEVIGCPSMFFWGGALRVDQRVPVLDADSRIAITISPYRRAMGPICSAALACYPNLVYIAQDLDTLKLLVEGTPLPGGVAGSEVPVHPSHPLFTEGRARYYLDPWPWIRDLGEVDFVFGTRIHGAIAGLLAGTPATVLAHDSRTLELARYHGIPYRLLQDVSRLQDPAALHAEMNLAALHEGHADRFATFTRYLRRHGLDHAFAHAGAAEAFDRHVADVQFPEAVLAAGSHGRSSVAPGRFLRRARARFRRAPGGDTLRWLRTRLRRPGS